MRTKPSPADIYQMKITSSYFYKQPIFSSSNKIKGYLHFYIREDASIQVDFFQLESKRQRITGYNWSVQNTKIFKNSRKMYLGSIGLCKIFSSKGPSGKKMIQLKTESAQIYTIFGEFEYMLYTKVRDKALKYAEIEFGGWWAQKKKAERLEKAKKLNK